MTQKPKRTDASKKSRFDTIPTHILELGLNGIWVSSKLPNWISDPCYNLLYNFRRLMIRKSLKQ